MQQIAVFIDLQDQLNMFRTNHAAALLTANPPLKQDTIPHALICSLANVCPKHVELILKINKIVLFVASSWSCSCSSLKMAGVSLLIIFLI
jgi:hypothetical protein